MPVTHEPHVQWSRVDDVAVVEVLSKEIIGREASEAFGLDLWTLLHQGETRLLLNFARTKHMSSTGFGTLMRFYKDVDAADGELRICAMEPSVRFGADIISLGRFIPIHDDERSALAAFREKPPE